MEKPIIYFQFDEQKYFTEHYEKGYFSYYDNGFGPVIKNSKALVKKIDAILTQDKLEMDEIFNKRREEFFVLHDKNNCERVYNSISNRS